MEREMSDEPLKRCKWCNGDFSKLAKSHIIPQAFVNPDRKNNRRLVSADKLNRRVRTGSWDDSILCAKCESDYNDIDSKASDILLNNFSKLCIPFGNKIDDIAFQLGGQYKKDLKRFLIYTLWKCSVSQREEFRNVNLGVFEDRIKQDIISGRDFNDKEYSFVSFFVLNPIGMILPYKKKKEEYQGGGFLSD